MYTQKTKMDLYFIYTTGLMSKNWYISVINETLHTTISFNQTCLYTPKELKRCKAFLDMQKVNYKVGTATDTHFPPAGFILSRA